jgi:hypothetical protein
MRPILEKRIRIAGYSSLPLFYWDIWGTPPFYAAPPENWLLIFVLVGGEGLRDWWWGWEEGGRGKRKGKRKVVRGV